MLEMEQIANSAIEVARKHIADGEENLPMWFVPGEGRMNVICTPFGDVSEKQNAEAFVRSKLEEWGSDWYVFLSEAWAVSRPVGSNPSNVIPSEADDRIEVLMIHGVHRDGTRFHWSYKIIRSGEKPTLSEREDHSKGEHLGRFVDLFGPTARH